MAADRIPAGQALKNWKALLDRAQRGERLVITRDGKDVAALGPVQQADMTVRVVGSRRRGSAIYDNANVRDILGKIGKKT